MHTSYNMSPISISNCKGFHFYHEIFNGKLISHFYKTVWLCIYLICLCLAYVAYLQLSVLFSGKV